MNKEAGDIQFDRQRLKGGMVNAWKRGECQLVVLQCELGRVVAFTKEPLAPEILDVWGRVLQWFGPGKGLWKIFWFASEVRRMFPEPGQEMGPEHVNGGYTTGCSTDGIFIYRKEEATRVLIHEMMHAACLDEKKWDTHDREAMVEAWAELILVALLSRGDQKKAGMLWSKQAQWIADSNHRASHMNEVEDASDYAWRYLVGRREMFTRLGVDIPEAKSDHPSKSSRFTHPDIDVGV